MNEVILGMAKGRTVFETLSGSSGAGKRASSEVDLLRLILAVRTLEARDIKVHAYLAILRDDKGNSTAKTIQTWIDKYEARDVVMVLERQLSPAESAKLHEEKRMNAAAQEKRGGNASARYSQSLAEDFLHEEVRRRHPNAAPGDSYSQPFRVAWDAWYVVP
jgi:hypothetical protein